jgi:hypothetical protein
VSQVSAQPFVSAGDYSNFKMLTDGRSKDYATRYTPYDHPGNPDFNYLEIEDGQDHGSRQ